MKLSIKKWTDKITNQVDKIVAPTAQLVANTVSAARNTGSYTTGALITLQPYTKYLLFCHSQSNYGAVTQYYTTMYKVSGTAKYFYAYGTQPYAGSGGSHIAVGFCETDSEEVKLGISGYVYFNGYTHTATILAIPLMQTHI